MQPKVSGTHDLGCMMGKQLVGVSDGVPVEFLTLYCIPPSVLTCTTISNRGCVINVLYDLNVTKFTNQFGSYCTFCSELLTGLLNSSSVDKSLMQPYEASFGIFLVVAFLTNCPLYSFEWESRQFHSCRREDVQMSHNMLHSKDTCQSPNYTFASCDQKA